MANALSIGDILELDCKNGFAYVAFSGKDATLGAAVWVIPKIYSEPQHDWESVFANKGYFVFYAANTALKHRLVRRVAHSIEAMKMLPGPRRNAIRTDKNGKVVRWVITEGDKRVPKADHELSESDRLLPIADMWNHQFLLAKIAAGWMPEDGDRSFANTD
ncbi:MAG TPA: hypothetical protein VGO46_19465 [Gemmatimonadaceae bacterium]|jgi:hypothetical protein|nr:hypothetical protein [Gemmatimonadaceae bacterium]